MKRLLRAALAVLCLAAPVYAQQQTTPYSGRGPNTLTFSMVGLNDTATIYLTGSSWATVYWTIATAGGGAITTEISLDGGTNWIPSAWSKRLDAVSANPSTAPWANNGPVAGTYETPLPANCTAFRLRYQTAGTATSGTLTPGIAYAPGVPVVATLFDTTSAVNTAIDTGVLDTSGWGGLSVSFLTPAGGSGTIKAIDDAGAASVPNQIAVPASAGIVINLSPSGTTLGTPGTSGSISGAWRWKRTQITSAAVAALTSRVRVEAWR